MWLEHVQSVHLNGSVLDLQKGLTFSASEYAGQTAKPNPWYQAFVDDMYANSVLFVGSKLNEPPMYHYLALRSERAKGVAEVRAKGFVVTPAASAIRRRQLQDQGYVVVEAMAQEFFEGLHKIVTQTLPSRVDVLKNRYPHQIEMISSGVLQTQADLLRFFEPIGSQQLAPKARVAKRELFFEGVEPTWDDIANGLDARREVTPAFVEQISKDETGIKCFVLVGHAGSGKSTLLRRIAFELANTGKSVYFCKAERTIDKGPVIRFIDALGERHVYLFLDDAIIQFDAVDEILVALRRESNVTFVLADRPHVVYPRIGRVRAAKPVLLEMPYLDRPDCERIIQKLTQFGMLGELQAKPLHQQLQQFLGRSKKQLLVAMKEATAGRGFDVILDNEFRSLSSENARVAYTIACLAYMHGAPVHRRHLLASMGGTDLEKATTLSHELKEVIVAWNGREELLCPRHRLIAHQVATETAPPGVRAVAVLSFLSR
jgi:energy-coupling factor transporter ATP-binding protein EcfA2